MDLKGQSSHLSWGQFNIGHALYYKLYNLGCGQVLLFV